MMSVRYLLPRRQRTCGSKRSDVALVRAIHDEPQVRLRRSRCSLPRRHATPWEPDDVPMIFCSARHCSAPYTYARGRVLHTVGKSSRGGHYHRLL